MSQGARGSPELVRVPHTRPALWPAAIDTRRLASQIRTSSPVGCRVGLLGAPDDMGIALNRGRPGARLGPDAFRSHLAGYGAADPRPTLPTVFDAGDVLPAADLDTTHRRLGEAAATLMEMGLIPVVVGGGHDLTLGLVRGVAHRLGAVAGLYFDAHLDVRPEMGSGGAFRRLIEEGCVDELHLRGINWACNSGEHLSWFADHGGRLEGFAADGRWPERDMFVSFDLDVIDAAFAPGVSAPNPCGWTPQEACRWVLAAGRHPRVRCFDIMELSPPYDDQGRTALLAAHLFLTFLRGVAERR